ncbi:MAG: HEAT repeat domain-containing protein, partial [Pirellulaceae bacterium]
MSITKKLIHITVVASCLGGWSASGLLAQDDSTKQQWAEELIDELEAASWHTTPKDHWAAAVRDLVEIGPPAVVPICDALRETDGNLQMRLYGFALRAIKDPRAAPVLIESIPKTLVEPGSDMGVGVNDAELLKFMLEYDLNEDKDDDEDDFLLARPCREIMGALKTVTGHDMGDQELYGIWLSGSAAQIQMKKELYHQHAGRWKDWWGENARRLGVDMEFHTVELPDFERKIIDAGDPFRSDTAIVTFEMVGETLEPLGRAKYACFYDLDTGRECKLPTDFAGDPSDLDQVIAWAREQRYD